MDDHSIQPSKEAIYDDNGELDINSYDDQPLVYTNINDHKSSVNLFSLDNNFDLKTSFQLYDACINFPFAEITYKGNLLDTFLSYEDNDGKLNDFYGHFFSETVLVGGQLFIKSTTQTQIDLLKMYLNWAYNFAKCEEENQLYKFINLQLELKIETSDGREITTIEQLANWMKSIYQENMIDVISYIDPIPVSQLKVDKANVQLTSSSQDFNEKIVRVANYKDRLDLEEWIKDSIYVNLTRWTNSFNLNLFQGLITNENFGIEIAKKVAIDLIKYPYLKSKDSFDLKFKKPTNTLEKFLMSNNISSMKETNSHAFNNKFIMNDELKNDVNNFHLIVNHEQYEILLPWDHITLSKEFKHDIEKAIQDMKPYKALQNVFGEYGHLFPQKIMLGRSFKYISTKFSPKFGSISKNINN